MTDSHKNISVVILAAGKGKRMKSDIPKVLHRICFKPIIYYILKEVFALEPENVYVVAGFQGELVEQYLRDNFPAARTVFQKNLLGTADAVSVLAGFKDELGSKCLILAGDMPLIQSESLARLLQFKRDTGCNAALLTTFVDNPCGYGRIIKDEEGSILKIVEDADATLQEKLISEINPSVYCFDTDLLFEYLKKVKPQNSQGEFYLTDLVGEFVSAGLKVKGLTLEDSIQVEGINDRVQLSLLEKIMRRNINEGFMLSGVTIKDPENTYLDREVEIGKDTVIEPFCFIYGKTKIGKDCIIGPFSQIEDSTIGDGTKINKSVVQGAVIGRSNNIGPTSYIRPLTVTGDNVKIGACCEIKKSTIASGSKVPHLSYIGDAQIGSGVNVGAATVTCNYDGFFKNRTIIEDGVFIGSDTMLVAPLRVGRDSITAAGSVISRDVPPGSLAIERGKQVNVENGALKFRNKKISAKIQEESCEENKKNQNED